MSAITDQLLEVLQADVHGVLKHTPALVDANVLSDNEGDIEAKVARALGTLSAVNNKRGLAVVVLLPEVTESEANLPGPPLTLKVEIRTLENVMINRGAGGSGLRSSQAAINILSALHLRGIGSLLLYSQKDPITPVDVKPGHVSHAVTLFARVTGLVSPRCGQVRAALDNVSAMSILSVSTQEYLRVLFAGTVAGKPMYSSDGELSQSANTVYPWITLAWDPDESYWVMSFNADSQSAIQWTSTSDVPTPDLASGWTANFDGLDEPVITPAGGLQLTCATPASAIYYTTDGSFPTLAAGTLYTIPIAGLETGTIIRAVAYAEGLDPSDLTEIMVTE